MDDADWPAYKLKVLENIANLTTDLRRLQDEMIKQRQDLHEDFARLRQDVAVGFASLNLKAGIIGALGGSVLSLIVAFLFNKIVS